MEVKRYFVVSLAVLFVLPATGGRSSAVVPRGLYVKYQELTARYFREHRYDDAREAARHAYDEVRKSTAPSRITRPLASLCAIETATFRYREAAQVCLEAQRKAAEFQEPSMMALAAFHLSNLYFHLGAVDEAEAAMEQARLIPHVDPRVLQPTAMLHHEARLKARRESPDKALPLFVNAANAALDGGDMVTAAQIWDSAAREFLQRGRFDEADRLATESFRIRRLHCPADISNSLLVLSELRFKQGDAVSALNFAEQAFQSRNAAGQPVYWFYLDRGVARRALGQLQAARIDLEEAAAGVRAERLTMAPADSLRLGGAGRHQEVFRSLASLYADLYWKGGAQEFAEKGFAAATEGRAYAFRETSGELARVRPRLTQTYFTTVETHRKAEEALFVHNTPAGHRELAALRLKLTELELAAGLDVRVSGERTNWAHQSKPGEALLQFSLGEKRSLLWAIAQDRVWLTLLPPRAEIEVAASAFRAGLELNTDDPATGRKLYQLLFSHLPAAVQRAARWRIVADGELAQIPFAAIENTAGRYLVTDHSIRMVPDAYGAPEQQSEAWNGPATAFGDPVYNPADGRIPDRRWLLDPEAPWLPRLPGTSREIRACSRLWGERPEIHLGTDVDIASIRQSLQKQPALLHFAMHMVPGPHNPAETRLALTVASDGTPRFLDPATIATMDVHSRLVVLSGCRAGSGSSVPGEGIAGLGRAWLLAGVHSVAATLWPVDDDSGEFLQAFYRSLHDAPEEAVRQAQLEMIQSGTWRARPRYWAAYFVMGRA